MMKYLIVNADDFNLTPGVRQGIITAFSSGIVRSTTLMVNLPAPETATELLKRYPGLGVGLHGNLTWGKPVLPHSQISTLLDAEGNFYRKPPAVIEHANLDEAEAELEAQINLALHLGITLTHLDSHHHLHSYPPFDDIFLKLASRYQLPLRSINDSLRSRCRNAHIPTPDGFSEEFYGAEKITQENLIKILKQLSPGITEICCHPAYVDELLAATSSYAAPRSLELKILTSPDVFQALADNGISLINYRYFKS